MIFQLPQLKGIIRRRVLVNFRADPDVVQPLLPEGLRPKLYAGYAIVGICLIRLEHLRPSGLPAQFGFSSENAAHRFAVEWDTLHGLREAVYIMHFCCKTCHIVGNVAQRLFLRLQIQKSCYLSSNAAALFDPTRTGLFANLAHPSVF